MQHQKIRPQTMTPSTSAATPAQDHSTRMRSACLVTPDGQPNRRCDSASRNEQPDSSRVELARMSASTPPRVQRLRCTSNRLSAGRSDLFGAYLTTAPALGRGRERIAGRAAVPWILDDVCGLIGFLSSDGDAAGVDEAVRASLTSMRHRGPDEGGTWSDA